jgi:UDP-N-acetylglucosamine 1-carboxyvinyltransferase
VKDGAAVVWGPAHLRGATVCARDLRAGAALVLAGLSAEGETIVTNGAMIERGHAALDRRLQALGAQISRTVEDV